MVKTSVANAKRFATMLAHFSQLCNKTLLDYTSVCVVQQHFVIRVAEFCVDGKKQLCWQVQFIHHANIWQCFWQMCGTFGKNGIKQQKQFERGKNQEYYLAKKGKNLANAMQDGKMGILDVIAKEVLKRPGS